MIKGKEIFVDAHLSPMLPTMEMSEWVKYYRSRKATLTNNTVIIQQGSYILLGKDIGEVKILLGPEEANPYPPDDYGDSSL